MMINLNSLMNIDKHVCVEYVGLQLLRTLFASEIILN